MSSVAELCIASKERSYLFSLYLLPNNSAVCLLALVLRGTMTRCSLFHFFLVTIRDFLDLLAKPLFSHLFYKIKSSYLFNLHQTEVIPYLRSPLPFFHNPFSVIRYNFCDGMTRTTHTFTVEVHSVAVHCHNMYDVFHSVIFQLFVTFFLPFAFGADAFSICDTRAPSLRSNN